MSYNSDMNICECGCGLQVAKQGNRFVHGHHAKGRKKSEEEKRKIGEKNSVNMKRYMQKNKDVAKLRGSQLRSTWTADREKNRIEATKLSYASMSTEDKQKFSDHANRLWADGTLIEAHPRAAETFKQRFQNGDYDFEERNDKISETITQRYLDGGFEWSKGEYRSSKTGRISYYRSSWELQLMKQLDDDSNVQTWEYEFDRIEYEIDGKIRRYVPDFHVTMKTGRDLFIEVKPESLRETSVNDAKRRSALSYCDHKGWSYVEWKPGDLISLHT